MSSRRKFIRDAVGAGMAVSATAMTPAALTACVPSRKYQTAWANLITPEQAPLPYAYAALEPFIDAQTMEIHYSKHAAAYAKNFRDALAEEVKGKVAIPDLIAKISTYSPKMRNNLGGHYNHEMFWQMMKPGPATEPAGKLKSALETNFGSVDAFKSKFKEAAMGRFGSGWAWLFADTAGKLQIGSTPNQDNPLMDLSPVRGVPLLGLDVWEHAYYLKYQNRRADYVEAWWKLVHWDYVGRHFDSLS